MRDILKLVKREEITRRIILPKALARGCRKGKTLNITACAGVVQCDYHEHAEEFIKSASDAISMSKKESKGK
jgi:GGDEF domain-containing protein